MVILIKMLAVLSLMVFLLRRKAEFGNAMLAATLLLFLTTDPEPSKILYGLENTVTKPGTWFMLLTLYFVMCLEHILRTSGILKDFTASARKLFGSDRVLLGFMPAFLGFLPSLGGAIFSAPLVKEAGKRYHLSAERLTAINYWFRHIWEFSNPILPVILLASQILLIPVGTLISHLFIFTIAATIIGIFVLLLGKPYQAPSTNDHSAFADNQPYLPEFCPEQVSDTAESLQPDRGLSDEFDRRPTLGRKLNKSAYRSILLAAGPILVNVLLVVVFNLNTALSIGLVLIAMAFILRLNLKKLQEITVASFSFKIQWGIINILFFQEMLFATGTIDQIINVFETSGIPILAILSITAFVIGLLIGSPQGFVAVTFPLIAPLAQGNMDVIAFVYVCGLFGIMASPAHLCLIVTLDYFKADFLKTLLPIILMEVMMILFALIYIFVF